MYKPDTIKFYNSVICNTEKYIEENMAIPFGIDHLADGVNFSYHHISAVFLKLRNESLGNYIKRRRLEKAATLYRYTGLNLDEVACQTGFATKTSLSKSFSGYFKVSPGNIRKASLYRKSSPNIIMDGISSKEEYFELVNPRIIPEHKEITLTNYYLTGRFLKDYTGETPDLIKPGNDTSVLGGEIFAAESSMTFIKAFDSLNYTPLKDFRMLYGNFHMDKQLALRDTENIVLKIKPGKYLAFDVPANAVLDAGKYITMLREGVIHYQKSYTLHDFYDFFLLDNSNNDKVGQYYIYIGPASN